MSSQHRRLLLINAVGLTAPILAKMPMLNAWASAQKVTTYKPLLPAVTCAAQATFLTGELPAQHGIVGNGWYFKDLAEINFWRQSYHLVQVPYLWEKLKAQYPAFKVANIGWWYNMYCGADYAVTPRPQYRANGLKKPDCYTVPATWRDELQSKLGQFPLFKYWGPMTSIASSDWLAKACWEAEQRWQPDLSLLYLPHLDYCLQRRGEDEANLKDFQELDVVMATLINQMEGVGVRVAIMSEYGINPVSRPVHLNRVLRKAGLLKVRVEQGGELLDAGASLAFAVADHQIAHVYVQHGQSLEEVKQLLLTVEGVAQVLDRQAQMAVGLNHERAGDLLVVAAPDAWFTYYYWLDDNCIPDFARMVEIHKKPGYDPAELFFDPAIKLPKLAAAFRLLRRKLGFRALMDLTPITAEMVKGSHGAIPDNQDYWPVMIGPWVPDNPDTKDGKDWILGLLGMAS